MGIAQLGNGGDGARISRGNGGGRITQSRHRSPSGTRDPALVTSTAVPGARGGIHPACPPRWCLEGGGDSETPPSPLVVGCSHHDNRGGLWGGSFGSRCLFAQLSPCCFPPAPRLPGTCYLLLSPILSRCLSHAAVPGVAAAFGLPRLNSSSLTAP